jgi:hypothetical protein
MVAAFTVTPEEKKQGRRNTCVKEDLLRQALGECPDDSTTCFALSHKLYETTETDFLPSGKLCKLGSGGVLLLESERDRYEKNYCNIDPESSFCKSRTPTQNTGGSGPAQKIQGVETKTEKSNGGAVVVFSVMSSSSLFIMCIALIMMSGKLF